MSFSRRSIIFAAGGAALALVGGPVAYRVTRTPDDALKPWAETNLRRGDIRLEVLSYAILAPNPHNRQPWLIRLVGDNEISITCDLDRRLPETDPFDRQITIGFGGFIELARMAAAERGYRVDVQAFQDGEPEPRLDKRPIAQLTLTKDQSVLKDHLFEHALKRRSNKLAYDLTRKVSAADMATIKAAGGKRAIIDTTDDPARVASINALNVEAATLEFTTERTWMETVRLMRIGANEINANPDGIGIKGAFMESLKLAGMLTREQMADVTSTAYKTGFERYMRSLSATPAFLWLITATNTRKDQLTTGRDWLRANLAATAMGLSMNPASQALQEYAEMTENFSRVHKLFNVQTKGGINDPRVQMVGRLGYGPEVGPAHRWALDTHLTKV